MRPLRFACAALLLGGNAMPAAAQSFDNTGHSGPGAVRVQAGIVIPLGGGGTEAERAPRLEAWSDRTAQRPLPQANLRGDFDPPGSQPVRIGVNFTGETRVMLNGREMPGQENRKGISALGVTGIVVGVLVLGAVVFVIEYKTSGLGD